MSMALAFSRMGVVGEEGERIGLGERQRLRGELKMASARPVGVFLDGVFLGVACAVGVECTLTTAVSVSGPRRIGSTFWGEGTADGAHAGPAGEEESPRAEEGTGRPADEDRGGSDGCDHAP